MTFDEVLAQVQALLQREQRELAKLVAKLVVAKLGSDWNFLVGHARVNR